MSAFIQINDEIINVDYIIRISSYSFKQYQSEIILDEVNNGGSRRKILCELTPADVWGLIEHYNSPTRRIKP